jgi:hypothetical protein
MAEVDRLQDALEGSYPRHEDLAGDWNDVLQRAERSPRSSRWALPTALAAGAVAGLILLLVAPWDSGTGIVERARAAVGDGPVVHFVLRSKIEGRLVPLEGELREQRVFDETEIWWDPSRGFHEVARFGGAPYVDALRRSRPRPDVPSGFVAGYREALESGQAKAAGDDEIGRIKVTWLRIRIGGVTLEVAVNRNSGDPVRVKYTPGGNAAVTQEQDVVLAESLPAGVGDFSAERLPDSGLPLGGRSGSVAREDKPVGAKGAAAVLGQAPLWLGREHDGAPYKGFFRTWVQFAEAQEPRFIGVDAQYGTPAPPPGFAPSGSTSPWTLVSQRRSLEPVVDLDAQRVWPATRPGFVLVYKGRNPFSRTSGYFKRGGLYVTITASSRDRIISAARGARPFSAGSGAGG